MPSDSHYNNATATATAAAASPSSVSNQQRRDPRTYPNAVADPFQPHGQPPQVDALPCPRCDSINTKFCYYNNYNLSQPRHFCKSCRRYWTHGGTLRNVPVGGGTRKSTSVSYRSSSSNKRPRSSPAAVSPCSSSSAVSAHDGAPCTKLQAPGSGKPAGGTTSADGVGSVAVVSPASAFTSPVTVPGSNTYLALGGYGPGQVPALDGLGFGFGRGVWPFVDAGFIEGGSMYGSYNGPMVVPAGVGGWHIGTGRGGDGDGGGGGEGGLSDGEGFAWPELALAMPSQGLK